MTAIAMVLKKISKLLIAIFFTYIFITSAFVVSLISVLLLILWPISKHTYRTLTSRLGCTVIGGKRVVVVDLFVLVTINY